MYAAWVLSVNTCAAGGKVEAGEGHCTIDLTKRANSPSIAEILIPR